ncbi:MAG: hypothetical protein K2I75_06710 [Clostridiales bacterium]|nr:hypothetical protein [Clostridiales bacterium]
MSWLSLLLKSSSKYKEISADPARKATTSYFGISAIIASILTSGFILLCAWGVIALMNGMDDAGLGTLLIWVLVGIIIICAIFMLAEYIFGGLLGVTYQFRCNRRPISWIALIVFVLTTAAMIVGLIFIVDATGL